VAKIVGYWRYKKVYQTYTNTNCGNDSEGCGAAIFISPLIVVVVAAAICGYCSSNGYGTTAATNVVLGNQAALITCYLM
jgi:hypothetical protein